MDKILTAGVITKDNGDRVLYIATINDAGEQKDLELGFPDMPNLLTSIAGLLDVSK